MENSIHFFYLNSLLLLANGRKPARASPQKADGSSSSSPYSSTFTSSSSSTSSSSHNTLGMPLLGLWVGVYTLSSWPAVAFNRARLNAPLAGEPGEEKGSVVPGGSEELLKGNGLVGSV